jgi:hypothetical protein
MRDLTGGTLAHWSWERLRCLRDELGLDVSKPTDKSGEAS